MKILVTGATGFIGAALSKALLDDGHEVYGTTRAFAKLYNIDQRLKPIVINLAEGNMDAMNPSSYDIIFNCAGEIKNESLMEGLHVESTKTLLGLLDGCRTRWVQLSSVGVYGLKMDGVVREGSGFNPSGEYERTKAKADLFVTEYCLMNDIPFSILRPSNVFAKDMPNESLRMLVNVIQKGYFFYMSDGSRVRANYVHIDDVVMALKLCGFHPSAVNQDFIISDCLSQKEFVNLICKYSNKPEPKIFIAQALIRSIVSCLRWLPKVRRIESRINALTTKATYSTEKIKKTLDFRSKTSIKLGLKEFVDSVD